MTRWTTSNIPSQAGRLALVTGTGGLGYEDALALARAGADVVLAGRNASKGEESLRRIRAEVPGARVTFEQVDLASLASVSDFAARLVTRYEKLDLLINNAGVMTPPERLETQDGFELQLGTNYLSHFALTCRLMPLLVKAPAPRVVTVSSVAARFNGEIFFDDLNATGGYDAMAYYGQSKLACLMFALELQRRSMANGWGVTSIAAHPGIARTELLYNTPGPRTSRTRMRSLLWFLFQPVPQGALPTLFAATSPDAEGGGYYGPNGLVEMRGYPKPAKMPDNALDLAASTRLWDISEELTGVRFE